MKFNVGYRISEDSTLISTIIRYKSRISEVYFSFGDFPNGRSNQLRSDVFTELEAREKQLEDLKLLSREGLHFNLLFNGNCYGKDSLSRAFFNKVGDTTEYIRSRFGLASVTITSPIIAKFIKSNFDGIEVRASVNMEIGSIEGMDYISDYFDGYYMKRELNRSFSELKRLKAWCDNNGKKLYCLANSGCLNNCSVHNYHDNLVAHENEISAMDNAYDFKGKCWEYLRAEEKRRRYISYTNFIRPEDVHLYEGLFESMKLATRASACPDRVIMAYMNGRYYGGINDILEPNHSSIFAPAFLNNSKFPCEFATRVGSCDKHCEECGYCTEIYDKILTKLDGGFLYVDKQND